MLLISLYLSLLWDVDRIIFWLPQWPQILKLCLPIPVKIDEIPSNFSASGHCCPDFQILPPYKE